MSQNPTSNVPNQLLPLAPASGGPPRPRKLEDILDPFGIAASMGQVARAWMTRPYELGTALAMLGVKLQEFQQDLLLNALRLQPPSFAKAVAADERFSHELWNKLPVHSALKQYYLILTRWLEDVLYETPGLSERDRARAAFWVRQWLNAFSPSNFLLTNPVALQKALETHGRSLVDGVRNLLHDMRSGDVTMVDSAPFKVGKNIATTPGAVVFRNELMEVIHYTPTTPQVHALPLVVVPPWINKFYIMDLNEKKSLVGHLVKKGFSVFMISWRNPTSLQASTTFDDYMLQGIVRAVDVARDITGAPQVHAVGYCLGGTGLAATMAWYNREYAERPAEVPVAHWTTLTTLVDFSQPGDIGVFVDDKSIAFIEEQMGRQGYLDGREMSRAFRMLRSNSLIWQYFVHNYLYGETPPAFDVLFWNADATRMPRAMHSFYLREFYLKNKLVQPDALTLAGHPISLQRITQPLVAVGCEEDHIAPWASAYALVQAVGGPARFILSTSGHILGIINPPVNPPKRSYWMGEAAPGMGAQEWKEAQQKVEGSWWDRWVPWLAEQCGPRVDPPKAHPSYPKLAEAPGTYVLEA